MLRVENFLWRESWTTSAVSCFYVGISVGPIIWAPVPQPGVVIIHWSAISRPDFLATVFIMSRLVLCNGCCSSRGARNYLLVSTLAPFDV